MKLFFNKNRGIGLVEAMAAIAVLITGIISVVTLAQSNLASSQGVSSRMIAINLAREGFEAVRIIRDSNWLKGCAAPSGSDVICESNPSTPPTQLASWDYGLVSINTNDATAIPKLDVNTLTWSLDFTPDQITHPDTRLSLAPVSNLYHQPIVDGERNTQFRRLLELYAICYAYVPATGVIGEKITGQDEAVSCGINQIKVGIRVISTVQWVEGGKSLNVAVEGLLYNWRFSYAPYEP